jgi:hypothetical protein
VKKRLPQFKSYTQIPVVERGAKTTRRVGDRKRGAIIAKRALVAGYGEESEPETCIVDLLADLRHICDAIGADFGELDGMAYRHYSEELFGDSFR